MKRKLILAIAAILALSILFSTVSCGRKKTENETETSDKVETTAEDKETEATDESDRSDSTADETTDGVNTADGVDTTEGELESAFEITGEEVTLPDVSFEDDNG